MRIPALLICTLLPVAVWAAEDVEWPLFGMNSDHQRHSPLAEITPQNVAELQPVWTYQTGVTGSFQATPIVKDGVMFISLPFNDVLALDAGTGEQIWRYQHDRIESRKPCCGPANRGVAVADDRLFMGTVDGRLVALDTETGERLWNQDVTLGESGIAESVETLDRDEAASVSATSGAGLNMAPMVYNDSVIIGITGVGYGLHLDSSEENAPLGAVVGIAGEYGRRGFLAAYDVKTGEKQWQFDTVPSKGWEGDFTQVTDDGVVLPRDIENEKDRLKKYPDAWKYGGGSAWTTPAIDHQSGLLFFGVGNPSPQMEGSSRPGDNLYTTSLVALDAETGEYRWHYQFVPHDMWGYDVASPPVLFTTEIDGESRPVVGQAGKTGWFYVLDRQSGEFLYKSEAFVPQHNMFTQATEDGNKIFPGVMGGSNWSPVALDENRRQVAIAAIHWPVVYQLHEKQVTADKPALRYSSMSPVDVSEAYGLLSGIDIDSGELNWQYQTDEPLIGGVLSTDSGLVFTGLGSGELIAVDASDGQLLWSGKTQAGANAPPVTYQANGRQMVAVAVGGNSLFGFKTGDFIQVWALPDE